MAVKKLSKNTVRTLKFDTANARDAARDVWLASLGAASLARKQGEKLFGDLVAEGRGLNDKAGKVATDLAEDVVDQTNGMLSQIKNAAAANLGWVGDKVEDTMGRVMGRLGVPSKADIQELSRRVAELNKQVKTLQKAA